MQCKYLGKEYLRKVVSKGGNSGRVYVPKQWIDKKVIIILEE